MTIDPQQIRKAAEAREQQIAEIGAMLRATRDVIQENQRAQRMLVALLFDDLDVPQRQVAEWAGISTTKVRSITKEVNAELSEKRHSDEGQSDVSTTDFVPKIFDARQSSHPEEITELEQEKIEASYDHNALQRRLAESN
ncbi:hypothetical protein CRD16_00925 [Corynebacterium sp. LK29]|uniref:hypothetical protein n=1 Tax=Corynebacterium sp. LK29 TaxID=2044578 RepID=UPI0016523108|nr:hypothetical protein [Corynebacterium sp. LK29]MBC6831042.1 hypothetical protein [Corynebacterium sp. LK29]